VTKNKKTEHAGAKMEVGIGARAKKQKPSPKKRGAPTQKKLLRMKGKIFQRE
jgi:hypothetical protein